MIVVSGAPRSGTSMWMQILVAAGLPHLGERYPRRFSPRLLPANRLGFYESSLCGGVYYGTNPHPETGEYLRPEAVARYAVKIFIPGLIRTELAFLDRVIITVRRWREYARSLERLRELAGDDASDPRFAVTQLPADLDWWVQHFAVVRDLAIRGYPAHVVTYDALLRDPQREVAQALHWIGDGDVARAVATVEPTMRTFDDDRAEHDIATVEPRHVEVLDELYDVLDQNRQLDESFIEKLNQTHSELLPRIVEHRDQALTDLVHVTGIGSPSPEARRRVDSWC